MYSYWEKKYWDSDCDVAIIGSGLVGLYTANFLKDNFPAMEIKLLDRAEPPLGASTKNAGFACFGTAGEICSDLKKQSEAEVLTMLEMRWSGLQTMLKYTTSDKIDFVRKGGSEIFRSESEYEEVEDNLGFINGLIAEATGIKEVIKPRSNTTFNHLASKYLYNEQEGQLNPVLLVRDLRKKAHSNGVQIQAYKELHNYQKAGSKWHLNFSDNSELKCDHLVLATNAFTKDLFSELDIIPYRNQVIVSKEFATVPITGCYHLDEGYIYFRDIDNRILIGGGRHFDLETEQTHEFSKNDSIIDKLIDTARNDLGISRFELDHSWSGIIATGSSKRPIVKRISEGAIVAARSGGMGVAISSQIAFQVLQMFR